MIPRGYERTRGLRHGAPKGSVMDLDTLLDASEALLGEAEALAPEGGAASALALALGRACCASGADLEAMVQVARASLDSSRRAAPRRFAA